MSIDDSFVETAPKTNRNTLLVGLISLVTALFFCTILTSALTIKPNSVGTTGENFFFNADTPVYVNKVQNRDWHEISSKHVLRGIIWIPIVRQLEVFYPKASPYEKSVYAVILFNKICVALGFTLFSVFAWLWLQSAPKLLLFNALHLFSISTLITIAPDHFSQSYVLMSLSLLLLVSKLKFAALFVIQIILGILIAGTTTTNAIFSALVMSYLFQKKKLLPPWLINAGYVLAFIGFIIITYYFYATYSKSNDEEFMFNRFFNFQLYDNPLMAFEYLWATLTFPVVAPLPHLTATGQTILTFEPIDFMTVSLLYWPVFGLTLLLVIVGMKQFSEAEGFPLLLMALVWLAFNFLFHNVWGDEYMLYSPHYSFVLFAFIVYALKKLSVTQCVVVSLPIIAYQLPALYQITQLIPGSL